MTIRSCISWMSYLTLLLASLWTTSLQSEEATPTQDDQQVIWHLKLSGIIGPATSDLVQRSILDATSSSAHMLVIEMDTPGGLDSSMRDMIQAIIDARIPIATFVYPKGARAASAGTYLLYASHIAAMAPATNLGAATPVQIGVAPKNPEAPNSDEAANATRTNPMQQKMINDAAAYIRSLADLHDRNADWAEKAVREAASLSAREALDLNVIDVVANSLTDLLNQIDGRELVVKDQPYRLKTSNVQLQEVTTDWRYEFLLVITNPNVAYILMLAGIYGLLLEFYNPGVGLPGIVGGISLLVALYAFQLLPISYAGLALIILGIGLMVVEALSPSFGIFGLGGAIAFAIGSVLLMDTDLPAFQIALPVVAAFTAVTVALCIFVLAMALRARKAAVVSGPQTLIGCTATALEGFSDTGKVMLNGEIWNANTDTPVTKGELVTILAIKGLCLDVKGVEPSDSGEPP